jgi:hypothetical protein
LDELARGLAKEIQLWQEGGDPLLFLERQAYLRAIRHALSGLEAARAILGQTRQRLEERTNGRR